MVSPDTIILLIVDYRAAIGGQDHRSPCVCPCRIVTEHLVFAAGVQVL